MFDATTLYGAAPQAPSMTADQPMVGASTDDVRTGFKGILDPNNPLTWFGVFLAATVGFAGIAGSARIGAARVSANLGKA